MNTQTNVRTETYLINDARERAIKQGIAQMSEVDLLALLLRSAGEKSPITKAVRLLKEFRSIRGLLTAERCELTAHGVSDAQFVVLQASMELTRRHYEEQMQCGPLLTNPRAMREYVRMRLRDLSYEVFALVFLDTRHRVIKYVELFRGTIDGATI